MLTMFTEIQVLGICVVVYVFGIIAGYFIGKKKVNKITGTSTENEK